LKSDARLRDVAWVVDTDRRNETSARRLVPGVSIVEQGQENIMARKPATRVEFTLFDVVYEDGSQRSNRRVPSEVLSGLDGDAPARAIIEEQDRLIAEKSGIPAIAVKSIHRSGSKKADETMRSLRYASASD
jgi:hypothetical protein